MWRGTWMGWYSIKFGSTNYSTKVNEKENNEKLKNIDNPSKHILVNHFKAAQQRRDRVVQDYFMW